MERKLTILIGQILISGSILLLNIDGTDGQTCNLRLVLLTIQRQDCIPRKIIANACRGACTSYSRPSNEFPNQLERFCQCCDADENVFERAFIICPNMDWQPGQSRYRRINVQINLPRSCRCRPCSNTPQHITPAEEEYFEHGKRSSSVMRYGKLQNGTYYDDNDIPQLDTPFIYIDDPDLKFSVQEV